MENMGEKRRKDKNKDINRERKGNKRKGKERKCNGVYEKISEVLNQEWKGLL